MLDDEGDQGATLRCGFVALAGVPNAGKSTLMNAILGQKISIATSKPQTTRNRILGVQTLPGRGQVIFVDTPGIHKPHRALNEVMVDNALRSIGATDLVMWVVDATRALDQDGTPAKAERFVAARLAESKLPVILVMNKIDRLKQTDAVLPILEAYQSAGVELSAMVPVSALEGDNLDGLLNAALGLLPEGPMLYPEDMLTDRAERFIAAELIREAITLQTRREIPYSVAVVVDAFSDDTRRNLLRMRATIYVERKSQKGIMIGKGGSRLKQIGSQSRSELERFFGRQVYLDLHVTVASGWSNDLGQMRKLGYERDA